MCRSYDALVVGGGFFGLFLAETLARRQQRVLVCERGPEVMARASFVNQARVHNGYHYPRSLLTALRSRVNYPRFCAEFSDCIDSSFRKYYGVGRFFSKVTATQFRTFMDRIGAPVRAVPDRVRRLFDPLLVEDVFEVEECAFNAEALRHCMLDRIQSASVELWTNAEVTHIRPDHQKIEAEVQTAGGSTTVVAQRLLNCAYSGINRLCLRSGIEVIPLKHEITEMALIEVPEELGSIGVTIMCGPFFSCMPFPPAGLHTLSHVRWTPHSHWQEGAPDPFDAYAAFDRLPRQSASLHMLRDAARYLPALKAARHRDSLWEIKTTLPRSEVDDGRPILFRPHHGMPNHHVILGAKIDNVYDVSESLDSLLRSEAA